MTTYAELDAAFVGPQGPQGYAGASGAQGAAGVGIQGPQGAQGPQGPQGLGGTGGNGPQGPQGARGPQGSLNSPGAQGPQGGSGTGAQGYRGADGGPSTYPVTFGGNSAAFNSNGYMGAFDSDAVPVATSATAQRFIVPQNGALRKMMISVSSAAFGARANTFTVRINGVDDSTFTKLMNAAAGSLASVSGSVAVSAGDEITVFVTANGAGSGFYVGGNIRTTLSFEAT